MKIKYSFITLSICLCLIWALSACGGNKTPKTSPADAKVIQTLDSMDVELDETSTKIKKTTNELKDAMNELDKEFN